MWLLGAPFLLAAVLLTLSFIVGTLFIPKVIRAH